MATTLFRLGVESETVNESSDGGQYFVGASRAGSLVFEFMRPS